MAQSILINSSSQAFNRVLLLILIQVIITSAEYLSIAEIFKEQGFLSWKINRLSYCKHLWFTKSRGVIKFLENQSFNIVLLFRVLLALVILILLCIGFSVTLPLVVLSVITLFMTLRTGKSNNGADQMAGILILSLVLCRLFSTNLSNTITLLFITAQASLAYATSGFLKLTKAGWRNGAYIIEILKTSTFGNMKILRFLESHRLLSILVSNTVVYSDILLSFAFLFPPPVCIMVLFFGVLLHLGIGIVMGLNNFIWSFCATYPAIYYISYSLYHNF